METRPTIPGAEASARRKEPLMHPEMYFDTFFRDMAIRMNFTRDLSRRHFEARRFLAELSRFLNGQPHGA